MENWDWTNEYLIKTEIGDDFTFSEDKYDALFLIEGYGLNRKDDNGIVGYKNDIFMYTVYEEFAGVEISFKGGIEADEEVEIVKSIISNLASLTKREISFIKRKI